MEVTGQDKVLETFLSAARELRGMGATRVEGLGWVVNFGPPAVTHQGRGAEPEPEPRRLSAEGIALHNRARSRFEGPDV